jgi:hypothetical protein
MSEDEPLRETWQVNFPVADLKKAAKERALAHREHQAYWRLKYDAWVKEMNDTAKVDEVAITGGVQRVLRYDQGLKQKVDAAKSRRDAHKVKADALDRWLLFFEHAGPGTSLSLRFTDVAFFFDPVEDLPDE